MRSNYTLLIVLFLLCAEGFGQQLSKNDTTTIPKSIYFSVLENQQLTSSFILNKAFKNDTYRFLKLDEDRIASGLSNPLYFGAFNTKASHYYLDTYKKLYDLKGQTSTFFNLEKLYEEIPQRTDSEHNK